MINILIVDDNVENLYLLNSIFDEKEYKITTARNGKEALDIAREILPQLIISDILMPVMDGYSFCIECKKDENIKNIPFIFYTATYTNTKDEEFALQLGAVKFIIKPQEPDVFIAIIKNVLKQVYKNDELLIEKLPRPEPIVLKEYNEILIRKLEDKMLQVEKFNASLQKEIAERKAIESMMRESEERFRSFFSDAVFGLYRITPSGKILLANSALINMLGYSSFGELADINLVENGIRNSAPGKEFIRQLETYGEVKNYKSEWVLNNGQKLFVNESARKVIDSEGVTLCYDGIVENITEKKKIENELQESRHLFETLALVSPVGIFKTDAQGNTIYVNPKWCEMSDMKAEDALGFGWLAAVHPDDREKLLSDWKKDNLKISNSTAEYRFLKKDGSVAWVIGNAAPEVIDGNFSGYIGTITDVTAIKESEIELTIAKNKAEEMNKLKSTFLANLSHELRTPLVSILGYSEIIMEEYPEDSVKEFSRTINLNGKRLLNTFNNLLQFSKIEKENIIPVHEYVDINGIIDEIAGKFDKEANEKGLQFIKSCKENPVYVYSDKMMLKDIFANLIDNAVKFTNSGNISVSTSTQNGYALIEISDTGIGIAPDHLKIIFDEFRQASEGFGRSFEGTGLGLTLTNRFLKLLDGEISVKSELKSGSVFTLKFKSASPKDSDTNMELPSESGTGRKLSVLYVENDPASIYVAKKFLDDICNVEGAPNSVIAKEKINKGNYDLFLMDINLGEYVNGIHLTKYIREIPRYKDIPVIAVTAYAMQNDREEFLAAGCSDYIPKPYSKEELRQKVFQNNYTIRD